MTTHRIGTLDDFPENRGTKVDVDGIEFAVFNLDGELYGIQNTCPHKRLPLHLAGHERYFSQELGEEGYCTAESDKPRDLDVRGGIDHDTPSISCPWHYLEWNLETGESPVRGDHVATYDVSVRDDGTVWVEL